MNRYMVPVLLGAGSVLLALSPQLALRANAAPQRRQRTAQQAQSMDAGLPWAYGFSAPANATAARNRPVRTGAAARPAAAAEDRDAIRHVAGSTQAFTIKQVDDNYAPADWFPQDHPAMPEVVAHGRRPAVAACGFCHYPNGKGRPNNAGPAGLPAHYILEQIQDFASGARNSWDKRKRNTLRMIGIAKHLSPADAQAAAEYFASMKWTPWIKVVETNTVPKTRYAGAGGGGGLCLPLKGAEAGTEPLGMRIVETPVNPEDTEPLRDPRSGFIAYVPPGSVEKGKALVMGGGNGKTFACAACHGEGLRGGDDNVPSLAGRSPSYLARQLEDFKHFTRVGPGSQLMQPVVRNLSDEDILNIVAYVASLHP
jgi:cytochrome c553